MNRKRGLSNVVATVVLVFITSVAVVIIAGVVIPFVKNNLSESDCFNYKDYFMFESSYGYNCWANSDNSKNFVVSVIANSNEPRVTGIRFTFLNRGNARSFEIKENQEISPEFRMLNSSKQYFEIPRGGEVRTYVFNSTENWSEARISAQIDGKKFCDFSDNINLEVVCEEDTNIA